MDKDKAIRSAKLTAAGLLDKARARTAVTRAGGQIAPSKYLPNVPRAVHAGGGRENGDTGGMNLYRGTNDSGESITGGIGEGLLFGTPHEDVARLYGDQISQFELPSHAKVLTEGTGEFSQITGRKKGPLLRSLRQGENLRDAANEAIARAKEAGYDAVHFNSMRDMGVAVINPSIVVKKADGGRIHAESGGKVAFMQGNHPDVPEVLYHGNAPKIVEDHKYHGDGKWTSDIDQVATNKNIAAQDFRTFRPSEYGSYGAGIYLSDSPKVASDFAQGIRADQADAKPHGQVMKLHVSMKQPFTDDTLRHPAWRDHIKDAIKKQGLWLGGINDEDKARAAELTKKLDDGTATVRDLFLTDTQHGAMVNQFGQQNIHKTIRNSGFDGIIAHRPDGSKEYVAFKPEQVKSATGNQGTFDPNDPDITKAEGGSATGSLREKALWPSAQAIKAGTGSREAHAEMVNKIKPVSPYDAPVSPASDEQVHDALTKDKQPKAFAPRGLEEGTPVAVRLDIPAYEKKNTWVVSVHHPKTDFTAGEVIGYDSVAHIGNPRFGVHPTGALNIASGKPKSTIATVHGNWKKTTPEDAFALSQTIHNDPQWRQVGMDPERHSYFYDRETQEPVMAADEALHIGPLVYAKNPVYGKKTDFAFSNGGDVSAAIALTRRFTKDGKAATLALKPKGK
jgi:hypothetical protein